VAVDNFTDAFAKLKRANEHMQTLGTLLPKEGFVPPTRTEYRPDEGLLVWVVEDGADLPSEIPLVLGDIVHNLRSSLDHAWWTLASRKLGRAPNEQEAPRLQFPIRKPNGGFDHNSRVKEVGPKAAAIARDAQPPAQWSPHELGTEFDYTPHPLGALRYLSNIDKHRQLHVAFHTMSSVDVSEPPFTVLSDCIIDPVHQANGTHVYLPGIDFQLSAGTDLVGLRVVPKGPQPSAHWPYVVNATVAIEPRWKVRPLVGSMFDDVAGVVASFSQLL